MKKEKKKKSAQDFKAIFPHLHARGEGSGKFLKVRKLIEDYASFLGKKACEVDLLDFIDEENELNADFHRYTATRYPKESTRNSQVSLVKTLAVEELKQVVSGDPAATSDVDVIIDPSKLKPHLRELWLLLPRVGGASVAGEDRVILPLTPDGKVVFKAMLAVDTKLDSKTIRELLVDHFDDLKKEISGRVKRKRRLKMFEKLWKIGEKLGLSFRKNLPAWSPEQLPPSLQEALKNYEERAPLGLAAFKDLESLAGEYHFDRITPHAPKTIKRYRDAFLAGAPYFELEEGVGIRDLLVLEKREDTDVYFNRYFDRYGAAERQVERPGYKRRSFESVSYRLSVAAVCAIGRFNGIFDLQKRFNQHVRGRIDRATKGARKSEKKAKMTREWIDGEINKLKKKFDEIIRTKSFLGNMEDLALCLFLPQLMTLRYLGYRQQCIRRCEEGKNIKFTSKNEVMFYYGPGEIKNEVPICQTLSKSRFEDVEKAEGIITLIDVLYKYKFKFLDVLRANFPDAYEEQMGDAFFAMVDRSEGGCLIKRFSVGKKGDDYKIYCEDDEKGSNDFRRFFTNSADKYMDNDHLIGWKYSLNPHFLRAICCDWLIKDVKMTWDEVSLYMGDTVKTLMNDYYEKVKKRQDAGEAWATFCERTEAGRGSKRADESVSPTALQAIQKSLEVMSEQLKKVEERSNRFEEETKVWRSRAEFLMERMNLKLSDLPADLGEPVAA
jgi:hypothetical protein